MKALRGLVVPPLINVANVVKLSTFIIKTVGDFMPNDHTNAPVIETLGKELVVEWWLQNSSGKHC